MKNLTSITLFAKVFYVTVLLLSLSCSGDKDESDGSDNNGNVNPGSLQTGNTMEGIGLNLSKVEPPYTAATPPAFGGVSGLQIPDTSFALLDMTVDFPNPGTESGENCFQGGSYDDICGSFSPGSEDKYLCQFIVDIRCRIFAAGPTYVKGMMESVDDRLSSLESRAEGSRVPCADSSDSAYNYVELNTNYTDLADDRLGAAQSINLGIEYGLSCIEDLGSSPNGGEAFFGFGQVQDDQGNITTYVREGNTRGGGSLAKVDEDGNVDFYKTMPEDKTANYATLLYSAGLVHVRVEGASSKMEMSFTGRGMGAGCGATLITDGTYLYAKANINHDLKCSQAENDDALGQSTGGPDFDASWVAKEYCLKVDQENSLSSVAMTNCTASNLSEADLTITPLKRENLEAYNAAKIFADKPTGVSEYSTEPIETGTSGGEQSSTDLLTFTCNQTHQSNDNRNCSTIFEAESIEAATNLCGAQEDEGGYGCCDSANVFINAYGPVTKFEVVLSGDSVGAGTSTDCP